ncbi:MAG: ABC transporter ATP-binding protein [Candidatus Marinimicrobia bacterium]|nr:ABC transporter ATP-binding protein [Candidatus Neomarinimicrobiota bacterium]
MEASISLKKVGKLVRDKTVLAGLSFGVERGSLVAIVGENDSGKSILLKLLSGYENPNYGQVFIHGLDMEKRRKETRKLIGYVPYESNLDPWLTLKQNILFNAHLYGIDPAKSTEKIHYYSALLNLNKSLNEFSYRVSGGEQKKTMLIRALIHNPDVLIMDEPTAFMDAESIRLTWDLIKELRGDKSIIYVSNSLSEIEQAHDRILVFNEGRILMDGHLDKLLESTMDYHQFQIEFDELSDDLYKKLKKIVTVVSPNKLNNTFHFYGRNRSVFFDVVREASDNMMINLEVKNLGLRDLLDSEFAGKGLN